MNPLLRRRFIRPLLELLPTLVLATVAPSMVPRSLKRQAQRNEMTTLLELRKRCMTPHRYAPLTSDPTLLSQAKKGAAPESRRRDVVVVSNTNYAVPHNHGYPA